MPKLTTEYVAGLKADGTDRWHPDPGFPGLGLRVTPAGSKPWIVRKKIRGELKKETLGAFPDMTPTAARRAAGPIIEAWLAGKDPAAAKAERQRAVESNTTTVAMLSERWMSEQVRPKRKPRTAADYEKLFKQHINPAVGRISVAALTWEDVSKFHTSMARTPRRANYAVSTLRALMNYAERIKLRPFRSNPCRDIEFFRERARERCPHRGRDCQGSRSDRDGGGRRQDRPACRRRASALPVHWCKKRRDRCCRMVAYRLGASVHSASRFQDQ
jgi:hypothetical protein